MKFTRLVIVVSMAFALTVIVVGIAAAAPTGSTNSVVQDASSRIMDDPTPEPTVTPVPTTTPPLTPTVRFTHPVGLAISLFFHIPYTQVMTLHDSGIGFGVIARVYLTARASNGALTPEQVLALFQSGMGWGEIAKQTGIHPGGKGLGSIMSGHADGGSTPGGSGGGSAVNGNSSGGRPSCPGNSCNAPGHDSSNKRGPKK